MFPQRAQRSILRNRKKKKEKKKEREKIKGTTLWQQLWSSRKEGISRCVHSETDDGAAESSRLAACHWSRGTLLTERTVITLSLQRDDQRGPAASTTAGSCHSCDASVSV